MKRWGECRGEAKTETMTSTTGSKSLPEFLGVIAGVDN